MIDKHSTAQTNAVLFLCNYIIDKNKSNIIDKDIVCSYLCKNHIKFTINNTSW